MPVQKYSNYLEVNPLFESVVDIDADQRNPHLWQEYALDTVADNVWPGVVLKVRHCSCLVSIGKEDVHIPGVDSLIAIRKTLGIFIPGTVRTPQCKLERSIC